MLMGIFSLNPTDRGAIQNAQAKENALHQKKTVIQKVAIVSKLSFLDKYKTGIFLD